MTQWAKILVTKAEFNLRDLLIEKERTDSQKLCSDLSTCTL